MTIVRNILLAIAITVLCLVILYCVVLCIGLFNIYRTHILLTRATQAAQASREAQAARAAQAARMCSTPAPIPCVTNHVDIENNLSVAQITVKHNKQHNKNKYIISENAIIYYTTEAGTSCETSYRTSHEITHGTTPVATL
jgi:hypothetical protein